jgi:hypothetical protein
MESLEMKEKLAARNEEFINKTTKFLSELQQMSSSISESLTAIEQMIKKMSEVKEDSKVMQSLVDNYDRSQNNDKRLEYGLACWVFTSMDAGVFINCEWLRNFTKQEILIAWASLATRTSQIKSRKTHIVRYINALARLAFTM